MNTKLLMPTIITAALGAFFFTHPAEARHNSSFFNGLTGNAQYQAGYGNRGYANAGYGQRRSCNNNNGFNGNNFQNSWNGGNNWNGGNRWNSGNGYNNGNNFNRGNGLFAQDQQLYSQQQRLQQRLAQGNLTPDQVTRLQNKLSSIQSREVGLNGQLTNRLTNEQTQLQSLLSSGTLNPYQQTQIQNRLARLVAEQSNIASGTPFASGGIWNGLRNSLGF